MNTIAVIKVREFYLAYVEDKPGLIGLGKNQYEAVGSLIYIHGFPLKIRVRRE